MTVAASDVGTCSQNGKLFALQFQLEVVYVTVGNPDFCLAFYLTGVHFRGELQHIGHVGGQKIKYGPIRTREISSVRLQEKLYG